MADWIQDLSVIGGSTSKSLWVEMRGTDGTAKTGLAYTDITATYTRPGGSNTSITMATLASLTASYSSGGWKEVTNGCYRFDLPDAAIAAITGGGPVLFTLAATGALPTNFQLIVVSKTVSSLNDIAATAIVSGGAITTSGGAVSTVTTVGTLTAYAGNTPQTGDAFARIGAAGAGLTALGDTRLANLDASVNSRMASYTQPTGFLAATFPGTVASTTNITGGTITTVTNLTNAPTNGDLTATMKTSISGLTIANVTTVATIGDSRIASILTAVTTPAATPTTDDIAAAVKTAIFTTVMASGSSPVYPTTQFGGMVWRIDKRAGDTWALAPTMSDQVRWTYFATVETCTVEGNVITLYDGTTQTCTPTGRETVLGE